MNTKIDFLVAKYLETHPYFVYPSSGDRHPSIMAIGDPLQPWLADVLGGPLGFGQAVNVKCCQDVVSRW